LKKPPLFFSLSKDDAPSPLILSDDEAPLSLFPSPIMGRGAGVRVFITGSKGEVESSSGAGMRVMSTRTPHSSSGFTYIALLVAIIIIGISLGTAGKYWQNVMMREKEEELLFRGGQYRFAIERYYLAIPGRYQLPQNIDDLLKDSRSAAGKRFLRQKYMDPITGEDFEVIRDLTKGNRITGVYSKSEKEPLRTTGFDEIYKEFEGKKKYNEWKFLYTPQQVLPVMPGGPGRPFPGQPLKSTPMITK
jgi:type II secretory pathway pseudopilin PulG